MPLAPLILKYKTKENHYLYDAATGRIIRVDPIVYEIIDDFAVLTDQELLCVHRDLGEENVLDGLKEIEKLRESGYLRPHRPMELSPVEYVRFDGTVREIGEFWQNTATLLILGITERCNLQCEYCCYSGHFTGQRTHSSKSMSLATAEKAILHYLEHEQAADGNCPITFYGGEALLESHVLKECVSIAERRALELEKTVRFAITTNGTLLDDEITDYLVEHDFLVLVSLDGPKAMHDRYRVFRDGSGSFDRVAENLRRFAIRHPGYSRRGLNMTLAPPFDLDATSRLLEEFLPDYPATKANLVSTGVEGRIVDGTECPTRYGCYSKTSCNKGCSKESFRNFSDRDHDQVYCLWQAFVKSMAEVGTVETAKRLPLATLLFEGIIGFYHRRNVTDSPPDWSIYVPCIPGFTRRFCDVDGNYRICERVDNSETYRLGNVWDGLDVGKLKRTMELRRHFGDCGNCPSLKICDICYARISETDAPHLGYDPWFDKQCLQIRKRSVEMLRYYTEIMESNPDAFDRPNHGRDSSYKEVLFCGPIDRSSP